jgi:SPP1 family phage portal protein
MADTTDTTQSTTITTYNDFLKSILEPSSFSGRKVLYANYTPKQMDKNIIKLILEDIFIEHLENKRNIDYLYSYYKGVQPILKKTKIVRPDINNKVLENNAFQIVEFKKGYVFGEPIQYVQRGDTSTNEISKLNEHMLAEDKPTKDKDLAEWMYIAGQGYRMVLNDKKNEEDDAPFELYTLDPRATFIVYSSNFEHEKLFGGTYFDYRDLVTREWKRKFSIYTDNQFYTFESKINNFFKQPRNIISIGEPTPHILGSIPIIEYPLNPSRIGLVELVITTLDALNNISSNDMDDIQQFVQALLVFINQEVDAEDFKSLLALGGVEINTSDPNKPADVKLLTAKLSHSETKIFYDRLLNNALTICGVPKNSDKASGGDTGQARLLGEGWTMADMRAKQDELAFIKSEKETLKIVLTISKKVESSGIKNLRIKDIDAKFTRNKSDNLLVKAQGLLNMFEAQVEPETAFTICGLFSDPHEAYTKAKAMYGENFWKINRSDKINNFNALLVDQIAQGNIVKTSETNKIPSVENI